MITSKTKINVFEKNFFTPSPLFGKHPLEKFQNTLILVFECIVLPKWTFFRVLAHCVYPTLGLLKVCICTPTNSLAFSFFFKIGRRLCFHLTFYRNFRKQFELSWFYTPFSSKEFLIAKWSQNRYWHLMLNWISHKKNLPGFLSNKASFENTKKVQMNSHWRSASNNLMK